ncbi:putative nedd8-activating enzyme e1 regulatory subunit protein [Eutypa lata UCREL1]|uniref:NEDD8-activating enzyme E1 regulatory subunit n=1 Tax=Eutypa lata (strain UCR-EL1) TaxID=1287681 RepID=M7SP90_EUTLA|nr:putative nedd8-activating enzyme e1 regulatory subunit protein [Eutypa lata UCREL1]
MTEIVTSQTPPILHGPTEKEKKYDRQLRLWAASGQAALESAHILLVNTGAGCVGVETLKNLVLPGIGKFTIADSATVKEADLGVNFFLDKSCLGKPRSECCTKLLQELNPEVEGDWFPKQEGPLDLTKILGTGGIYTMIMYTYPIRKEDLSVIESYASQHKTPVVSIHSAGFYSYFKINLPGTFPIVDTHPEVEKTSDLRLLNPWPELVDFSKEMTKNLDSLDNHDHGHIPYVVILLYYLEQWRQSHNGENPISSKDKREFRHLVLSSARTNNPEGGEENFQEAEAAINKNIVAPRLEDGVKEIFNHQVADGFESKSTFWLIAEAVKIFYEKHGCLPLPGALPDMKAQSSVYVKLQSLYKTKARKDAQEVFETVKGLPGGEHADFTEVELFCKNARFVKLINAAGGNRELGETFAAEKTKDQEAEETHEMTGGAMSLPKSNFFIYLALIATAHNPGATADDIIATIDDLVPHASDCERFLQAAQEVARAGGGELHNISALTGGMVAQEAIKIITKQYIPIDNTCIFDGISSRCQVLRL